MHATAFLKDPDKHDTGPVVVLFGKERFLKQTVFQALLKRVLGDDDPDQLGLSRFDGKETDLKTVCDELRTVSMWGEKRIVAVDDADEFVSNNRIGLEKYVEKPAHKSVLVLFVKTWPKTTRLAKKVAKAGLDLECKLLKGAQLTGWLSERAREEHQKQLPGNAASLLIELAGGELGLLDQELAKLASYVGDRNSITVEDVQKLVGGWKADTTFKMLNALHGGNLATAITLLDKLLIAGEAPLRILGGIGYVYRKLAHAVNVSQSGRPLGAALRDAGVFPAEVGVSEKYLRRIGRKRAEMIPSLLLTADGNLKMESRVSDRLILERLLVQFSGKG